MGRSNVFVEVPPGSEVVFYKDSLEPLSVPEAEAILRGDAGALPPARVIRARMNANEMTLAPATEFWKQFGAAAAARGVNWHAVAAHTPLSYFLHRYPHTRIHWIACSGVVLKKTGKR